MRPIVKQSNKKAGWTIVELLTVMSIIIILVGLLVPSLNKVKQYAKKVKQRAQFHGIDVAMEFFNTEFDGYPNSDEKDEASPQQDYCGAMKLCEAMVGMDLLGFHPDSRFRKDGTDGASPSTDLYPPNPDEGNLKDRKGLYLKLENANAYRLKDIYDDFGIFGGDGGDLFVLCDVYKRLSRKTGIKVGMPILYYRANISGTKHSVKKPFYPPHLVDNGVPIDDHKNFYDYEDNDGLVQLGMPWDATGAAHLMAFGSKTTLHDAPLSSSSAQVFYNKIWNDRIQINDGRPYRSDSYILLSAGFDGEYGTADDIFNFEK